MEKEMKIDGNEEAKSFIPKNLYDIAVRTIIGNLYE